MPFIQRVVEPKHLSRTSLQDAEGVPLVLEDELEAVTNNTLSNALRQLASIVLIANDIFQELNGQLKTVAVRSEALKARIAIVEEKVSTFDPKKVAVPESDIATFALIKNHYASKNEFATELFTSKTRPQAVRQLYEAAAKTPVHLMRQMDRWRRDGHRSSRFFMCTPVLGAKRRKIRNKVDIEIETRMPAVVEELRRWTSIEALGDVTVTADGPTRIFCSTATDGDLTDGTIISDDEALDHKLPSPEEQQQVVALKFPAEIVAVDITGKSFDRMSVQRRSLLYGNEMTNQSEDGSTMRRRTRTRKPRSRRRNTLAGTDQKEIRDALTHGEDQSSTAPTDEPETETASVSRSKSSDLLRGKKESPEGKKSHFNTIKEWGKSRFKMMTAGNREKESKNVEVDNIYETVTARRKHERKPSCSSSENTSTLEPVNVATVRLRESSAQRRLRRSGENKDEPHSSSGNWSASSESGRASIGSEITTTTQPKSTTSVSGTSCNSLNQHPPSSVSSRRRFGNMSSVSGSVTSEGTLTPDIIHDLHEDGETSSVYSCDTEGYYTSFHMDSGLKTLKEEDSPVTPLHSTSAFSHSSSNNTVLSAENEYELFGKGSTSTTTSSAGTVCTTLRASESNRSLVIGPAVPERKSSLSKSPESSLERDYGSEKTGTVKRSPGGGKATVVAVVHKQKSDLRKDEANNGDVSPDSGHNTSSSPIESISSPNGVRSGSEFEFSESSDMEGADRIERIRVKTAINSSRIPSMCVITPSQSDDESVISFNNNLDGLGSKNMEKINLDLPIRTCENNNLQVINVNPQTGYATIENHMMIKAAQEQTQIPSQPQTQSSHRAPSPSGGSVTVIPPKELSKSPQSQPLFKATLLPLNNMFGKLKMNFNNLRRESKSPVKNSVDETDSGEYVTISDVKNNNEKGYVSSDVVNHNLKTVLSGKIRETEYISLNELPCNESESINQSDSLERRRKGARVTLNADGKVVYSSDSLKRKKGHSTFEPGPCVRPQGTPTNSPLPTHRTPKTIRPVGQNRCTDESRPLSPQLGKVIIKASSAGLSSPTSEIVRMPPSTIVSPTAMSPKPNNTRGAYVNIQAPEEGRALSPSNQQPSYTMPSERRTVYTPVIDSNLISEEFERKCSLKRGLPMYSTLPSRKPQYKVTLPERSVTPDITRGLEHTKHGEFEGFVEYPSHKSTLQQANFKTQEANFQNQPAGVYNNQQMHNQMGHYNHQSSFHGFNSQPSSHFQNQPVRFNAGAHFNNQPIHQNLGIPVQVPQINAYNLSQVPQAQPNMYFQEISSPFKVSPIDPRNLGSFHSSTPSKPELKAAVNLESKLLSPKKSTMSNEELYAAIHKSKKKMNISDELDRSSPVPSNRSSSPVNPETPKSKPESGYLDKSKSRLSWSPNNGGEYVDFSTNIDKLPNESRSRQSWACAENKKDPQTSRLDFKRLLLMHGKPKVSQTSKKISAVEQLKISKQQLQKPSEEVSILDLSASPRNLRNRKFAPPPGSPSRNGGEKANRPVPKLLSPRSQWRFANPRTDVLSSTIHEDCQEDESPNGSQTDVKKIKERFESARNAMTATQRLQAQRAQFFNTTPQQTRTNNANPTAPNKTTLETAF